MHATARRLVTILAVVAAALIGLPAAAHAGTGVISSTTTFAGWTFSAGGAVRARASSASVTWYKDTIDGSQWATAKITFKDASTDSHCARAGFFIMYDDFGTLTSSVASTECDGVYKTFTYTFRYNKIRFVTVSLDRGVNSENEASRISENPYYLCGGCQR